MFRATKPNAYLIARTTAAELKTLCQQTRDAAAAGPISGSVVRQLLDRLIAGKATFASVAAVPGIATYAEAQEGDPTYDVAAEFNAMTAAIDDAITWILAAVPVSGGFVLMEQWTAGGVSVRTFSTAQTAGLRAELDALIATID